MNLEKMKTHAHTAFTPCQELVQALGIHEIYDIGTVVIPDKETEARDKARARGRP